MGGGTETGRNLSKHMNLGKHKAYCILQGFHLNDIIFEPVISTEMLRLYGALTVYSLLENAAAAASELPTVLSGKEGSAKGKCNAVIS